MSALARACTVVLLAATAWLAHAPQASASGDRFMTAACTSGKGCACRLSQVSLGDWELVMGQNAPAGARDMVLVFPSRGKAFWTAHGPDQVNRTYGGRGQCPISLFPDEDIPADGIWEFDQGANDLSKCPLLTQGAVAGALPVEVGTETGPESGRMELRWGGKFDVRKYMHAMTHPNWHQVDARTWEYRAPQTGMIPAGAPVSIRIEWRSTLKSSTRIEGRFHYVSRMDIPGAQALAALKNTQCEITSIHTGRWVGPLPGQPDPRRDRESGI